MPFTVSHAVAVLPLATGRPGRELWPAALVIGSMVPDLPYFVPPHRGSNWSHAASGPVTIDLALGLLVFALWVLVLRRPLVDLAPRWLADRLPPPRSPSAVGWVQAGVSVVIGALTHVVWDSFTHPRRWGTDHLATLNRGLGPLPAYEWLQYGSGVLGLLALTVWTVLWGAKSTAAIDLPPVGPRGADPGLGERGGSLRRRRDWLLGTGRHGRPGVRRAGGRSRGHRNHLGHRGGGARRLPAVAGRAGAQLRRPGRPRAPNGSWPGLTWPTAGQ